MMRKATAALLLFSAVFYFQASLASAEELLHQPKASDLEWTTMEAGIQYAVYKKDKYKKPDKIPRVYVHIVKVDLARFGLTFRSLRPRGRSQRIEEIAEVFDTPTADVRVALNGDYYNFSDREKDPLGMHVSGGQVLRFPYSTTSLALTDDNTAHIDRLTVTQTLRFKGGELAIKQANESAQSNNATLYSGYYATETEAQPGCLAVHLDRTGKLEAMANNSLTLQVGKVHSARRRVKLKPRELLLVACGKAKESLEGLEESDGVTLDTRIPEIQGKVLEVISGGPRVLRDGKIVDETAQEGFSIALRFYIPRRHPRAAVGISSDGKTLFLLVGEGRVIRSKGLTGAETGFVLRAAGASDGMLFDGGGSAALFMQDKMVNVPHKKRNHTARAIANALAVIKRSTAVKKR